MWKRTHYKLSFTINKDTSGFVDDVDRSTGGNARMFGRHFLTNQGSVVDMEGQIKQERYLLNGVPFCLMSGDDKRYRVKVTKAVFKVCYAKLNPVLLLARKETLQKQEAQYPYRKTDVKCFGIPEGQYRVSIDDIFQGEIPDLLMVSLVSIA